MDSATNLPMPEWPYMPQVTVIDIESVPSVHFPKIYNAQPREGLEVATKLLKAGLHVTLFGRPDDFSACWREQWARLSFVALDQSGSCDHQELWDGLSEPTDAVILVRDAHWEPDQDGHSDDLEHDVVHCYAEQIYQRFIVLPLGAAPDSR